MFDIVLDSGAKSNIIDRPSWVWAVCDGKEAKA
jgi:hypothetical protein